MHFTRCKTKVTGDNVKCAFTTHYLA